MFGFMIKKSFCDGWDNLLSVVITNVTCLFIGLGLFYGFALLAKLENPLYLCLYAVIACIIFSILVFAYGDTAASIANFNGVKLLDFFKAIPSCIKDGALFGLLCSGIAILSYISVTYYWSEEFLQKSALVGVFLGALILWIDVFVILSLQWFVAIRSLMKNPFKKCLKKCFIIFFDNTLFCVAMAIHNIILIALSVLFIGFLPSVAGLSIAQTNALRLRLYKYDYLEEHPELETKRERKMIPWEELIFEDKEALGPRTWRNFLFPWKE